MVPVEKKFRCKKMLSSAKQTCLQRDRVASLGITNADPGGYKGVWKHPGVKNFFISFSEIVGQKDMNMRLEDLM